MKEVLVSDGLPYATLKKILPKVPGLEEYVEAQSKMAEHMLARTGEMSRELDKSKALEARLTALQLKWDALPTATPPKNRRKGRIMVEQELQIREEPRIVGGYRVSPNHEYGLVFMTFTKKPSWWHRMWCRLLLGWTWVDAE